MLYEEYFRFYTLEGPKYYFEMGALNGLTYSNTKFYEDTLGWTGILVEANPIVFASLVGHRPNNILMNVVCSDLTEPVTFCICENVPAVSSVEATTPSNFHHVYYDHS